MSLHQCVRARGLFVGVIMSLGLIICAVKREVNETAIALEFSARAKCKKAKLSQGEQVKEYVVDTCLGRGTSGEVWTLKDSDRVLKFISHRVRKNQSEKERLWEEEGYATRIAEDCLFGRIAAQKDPARFVDCYDYGTFNGTSYAVWQRVEGKEVIVPWEVRKLFPDLLLAFDYVAQLYHMFDTLRTPGTTAPGKGVRQWHADAFSRNVIAAADGTYKLVDYGLQAMCCEDPQECGQPIPGSEDIKIRPCKKMMVDKETADDYTTPLINLMLEVMLPSLYDKRKDWFQLVDDISLEDLVKKLQSDDGPSRDIYRDQWNDQYAEVVRAMATTSREKSLQWPPAFAGPLQIALESAGHVSPFRLGATHAHASKEEL